MFLPWAAAAAMSLVRSRSAYPGLLLGQVGRLGDPPAGWLAGVGLDQLALVEQLDQHLVGAGVQVLSEPGPRHGVERAGDFDVEVSVDLDAGERRHVVGGGNR
jgi:hypothetical protein